MADIINLADRRAARNGAREVRIVPVQVQPSPLAHQISILWTNLADGLSQYADWLDSLNPQNKGEQ